MSYMRYNKKQILLRLCQVLHPIGPQRGNILSFKLLPNKDFLEKNKI